MRQGTRATN